MDNLIRGYLQTALWHGSLDSLNMKKLQRAGQTVRIYCPPIPQNIMDILEEKCLWENSDEDGTKMLGRIL